MPLTINVGRAAVDADGLDADGSPAGDAHTRPAVHTDDVTVRLVVARPVRVVHVKPVGPASRRKGSARVTYTFKKGRLSNWSFIQTYIRIGLLTNGSWTDEVLLHPSSGEK